MRCSADFTLTGAVQLPAAGRNKQGSVRGAGVEKEAVSASTHWRRDRAAAQEGEREKERERDRFHFDFQGFLYMGTRHDIYSQREEGVRS